MKYLDSIEIRSSFYGGGGGGGPAVSFLLFLLIGVYCLSRFASFLSLFNVFMK